MSNEPCLAPENRKAVKATFSRNCQRGNVCGQFRLYYYICILIPIGVLRWILNLRVSLKYNKSLIDNYCKVLYGFS